MSSKHCDTQFNEQAQLSQDDLQMISKVFKTLHADSIKHHQLRKINFVYHPHLYNDSTSDMKELKEQSGEGSKSSKTFSPITKSKRNKKSQTGKATVPSKMKLDKKFFLKNALVKPSKTPVSHSKPKTITAVRAESGLSSSQAIMDKQ